MWQNDHGAMGKLVLQSRISVVKYHINSYKKLGGMAMLTGLSSYLPESTLTLYDNLDFLIRLLLAAGLGALVGL